MSLKSRTIHGLSWSLLNFISSSSIQFAVGIVLARLLSPREYGLIGMTALFTAISQTFMDSGFSTALIRKKNCTQTEYSTVFYYNIAASIIIYFILFYFAPVISRFFKEDQLINLIRIISLNIPIMASSQIQRSILIKHIEFKRLTIINAISMLIAGTVAIAMAYRGFGVWSLVSLLLVQNVLVSLLIWITSNWSPSLLFSFVAFRELFGFGSKILLSALLNKLYDNIYGLIIGKYFSVTDLGYYTRARRFSALVGRNVNSIIQSVTFPVLASISDDAPRLRRNYRRLIMGSAQLSSFLSFAMFASSPALIVGLLGPQWKPSIPYLQLLSLSGLLIPIQSLNLNVLKVMGKSGLFLKIEIYKKLLAIPTIFVGILYGVIPMLYMILLSSLIAFFINSSNSGKLIGYPTIRQIKDILPGFLLSLIVAAPVYLIGFFLHFKPILILFIQFVAIITGALLIGRFSSYGGIIEIREVVTSQLNSLTQRK